MPQIESPNPPSIRPMTLMDYANTLRYGIGSRIAPFLGIDFDEMSRRAAANQSLAMVPYGGGSNVVPFVKPAVQPQTIDQVIPLLNEQLKKTGYLGFDTLGQAREAIRQHPDWAVRWDVQGEPELQRLGDLYRKLVGNQMTLEKAGLAEQKYTPSPSIMDWIRSQILAPSPPPPSNVIPFPKR